MNKALLGFLVFLPTTSFARDARCVEEVTINSYGQVANRRSVVTVSNYALPVKDACRNTVRAEENVEAVISTSIVPQIVEFETGSHFISELARQDLAALAQRMRSEPELTLVLAGYADKTGTVDFNQRLSALRAEAVKQELINRGVALERVKTEAWGSDPDDASRRVEIIKVSNF